MKSLGEIELQLSRVGVRNRFFGKPEIRELRNVLAADEIISQAVNGRHEGGLCLLVATDRRLLLIDKKVFYLNMEDVRFDMISELDFYSHLLASTLSVQTINKVLRVTSFRQQHLRQLTNYLQERIMELRHQTQPAQVQIGYPVAQPVAQYIAQPVAAPQFMAQPQMVAAAPPVTPEPVEQFYTTQVAQPQPNRLKRIGSYPTSSLKMSHRSTVR